MCLSATHLSTFLSLALLTALTEGTFAAIYATIRREIEIEIDIRREGQQSEGEDFSMRPLVLAAVRETRNFSWTKIREKASE